MWNPITCWTPDSQVSVPYIVRKTTLVGLWDEILGTLDAGKQGILVQIDMSAPFDTISHTILLDRLQLDIGADKDAINWFRDFLKDRSQTVRLGMFYSEESGESLRDPPSPRYYSTFILNRSSTFWPRSTSLISHMPMTPRSLSRSPRNTLIRPLYSMVWTN